MIDIQTKSFPKVVVGTLAWNQKTEVLECLKSLTRLDYPNYQIVVIDNASTDGTLETIQAQYPNVHIVRHLENLGCAEGVNAEIRYAIQERADYLFIVDSSGTVDASVLSELVRVAERDPQIGIASPKVYGAGTKRVWFAKGSKVESIDWLRGRLGGAVSGVKGRLRSASPPPARADGSGLPDRAATGGLSKLAHGMKPQAGTAADPSGKPEGSSAVEDEESFNREEEADILSGRFCLVRMEVVKKVGFLDPYYFIYYDDADWFMRIHQAGYSGYFVPQAEVWQRPVSTLGFDSQGFHYYQIRNRLYFFRKYAPLPIFPIFFCYFVGELLFKLIPDFCRSGRKSQAKAAMLGFFDFLRGKRGRQDFGAKREGFFPRLGKGAVGCLRGLKRFCRLMIKRSVKRALSIRVYIDWNIGDEIITIPAFEALRGKYPHSFIEAQMRYPELLIGSPFVDSINQGERFEPDLIVDLHREARGKPRIDFLCEILGVTSLNTPRVYLNEEEVLSAKKKWQLNGKDRPIALCTSAHWFFARQWERQKWIELTEYFIQHHGASVFILGKDVEPLPIGINLIGKTTLREVAALLSQCQLFVGSDSGLLHLALSVGTPSVGLFGPLNPAHLFSNQPRFIPIYSDVECRGCWSDGRMRFRDHCPKIVPDCMTSISLTTVIGASETLLSRKHLDNVETLARAQGIHQKGTGNTSLPLASLF